MSDRTGRQKSDPGDPRESSRRVRAFLQEHTPMCVFRAVGIVSTLSVLIVSLAVNPVLSAEKPKRADKAQGAGREASVEELCRAGYELCREGQYDVAVWPLQRAATMAKDDPRVQLWFAHALVQTGQLREGRNRLLAAEKILAGPRGNAIANSSSYLACVRNYLGVLAALDHKKSDATAWFGRVAKPAANAASRPAAPASRDREAPEIAAASEASIVAAAEANRRVLDANAQFTWWVAPGEPLAVSGRLKSSPGLANEYARAADERWRRVFRGGAGENDPSRPAPAEAPTPKDGEPGEAARGVFVPPVIARLLDPAATLRQAQALAEGGYLNEALRLAEAASTMQPGNADTYLVLADLVEAKGWLRDAIEALDTAAAKGGDEGKRIARDQQDLIARSHPSFALEPKGLLTSPHFRLRHNVTPVIAQTMIAYLDRARDEALKAFGVELPVVYVRMFPDRASLQAYMAFTQQKPQPGWLCGYAMPSPHSPVILLAAESEFSTVTHEYAHLVVHSLAGPGEVPHWANEGIAEIMRRGRAITTIYLRTANRAHRLPSLERVERFFSDADVASATDPATAALYYDVTRGMTSFFLNAYGNHRLIEWLLLIRRGEGARQSFGDVTGTTCEKFFLEWVQRGPGDPRDRSDEKERERRRMWPPRQ